MSNKPLITAILELKHRWEIAEQGQSALADEYAAMLDFLRSIGLEIPPTLANGLNIINGDQSAKAEGGKE